MEETIYNLKLT